MILNSYKTKKVVVEDNLENILTSSLPPLEENSVVIITSKIVSITQGNVVKIGTVDKDQLVKEQAEKILIDTEAEPGLRNLPTIANNIFIPWAGIDESNGNGYYILWPKNPMKEAEKIWNFLKQKYHLQHVGVLIIDSSFIPLRTGSVSIGLAWYGFKPVKSYIGTPDIFGTELKYTLTSVVDSLSVAAGMCMGEGSEQKPLVVAQDIPEIEFVDRPPTQEEKNSMYYPIEKGLYGPLFRNQTWQKGENKASED